MIDDTQKLIIITAPSGSGKTTIVHHLLNTYPQLAFSISACTRNPRPNETDGVHYYFLSLQDFTRKIAQHEFAEFEMVYEGKYYGTLKSELQKIWTNHQIPLVDIDVQGALRLKKHYGANALSIFIKAPSLEILKQRLIDRGTETDFSLNERIEKATHELTYAGLFDTLVINDNLEQACKEAGEKILLFLSEQI
jgi:guanylate kinase